MLGDIVGSSDSVGHGAFLQVPSNTSSGMDVAQAIEPLGIAVGLADLKHDQTVAFWLHTVNPS